MQLFSMIMILACILNIKGVHTHTYFQLLTIFPPPHSPMPVIYDVYYDSKYTYTNWLAED